MPNDVPQIGQQSSRFRHAHFVGISFVAVMLTGFWQIIAALSDDAGLDLPHTWLDFREGRTTGRLEKQLDQKLPVRPTLIALANSLRYTLTGGTGEQVRLGKDDWLFLTDELRFHAHSSQSLTACASLLGSAGHQLERLRVKLVIALVPDKARLYQRQLASGRYPEFNASRYPDALAGLRAHGLTVVDLLSPLQLGASQGEVYYHSDTHWNQFGAQIAAEAIAKALIPLDGTVEKTMFTTNSMEGVSERPGDLIRLMGLENVPNMLRPRPDYEVPAQTRQSSTESSAGLFGDAAVPYALTGTSYSLRGNFHGYLQQALSAKVLNTAKDGGGLLQAASAYLLDESFQASKPKVLVWEVPERFLYEKPEDEAVWLKKVRLVR